MAKTRTGAGGGQPKTAVQTHAQRLKQALSTRPANWPRRETTYIPKLPQRQPLSKFSKPEADQSNSSLLSLPAELRLKILRFVLKHDGPLLPQTEFRTHGLYKKQIRLSSQIARSSQRLYHEACAVLYGENILSISSNPYQLNHAGFLNVGENTIKVLDINEKPPRVHGAMSPDVVALEFPICYLEHLNLWGRHYPTISDAQSLTIARFHHLRVDASNTDSKFKDIDVLKLTEMLRFFVKNKTVEVKVPKMDRWPETQKLAWFQSFTVWRPFKLTFAVDEASEVALHESKVLEGVFSDRAVHNLLQEATDLAAMLHKNSVHWRSRLDWGLGANEKAFAQAIRTQDVETFERLRLECLREAVVTARSDQKELIKEARDTRDSSIERFKKAAKKKIDKAERKGVDAEIRLTKALWHLEDE